MSKEHANFAFAVGIKKILAVINKMDTVEYSEERFDEIKTKISTYLHKVGYTYDVIYFVPISGFEGDNLIKLSDNMSWYKGPTSLQAFDKLNQPRSLEKLPLRFPIADMYKFWGIGTAPVGRIETRALKTRTNVVNVNKILLKILSNSFSFLKQIKVVMLIRPHNNH